MTAAQVSQLLILGLTLPGFHAFVFQDEPSHESIPQYDRFNYNPRQNANLIRPQQGNIHFGPRFGADDSEIPVPECPKGESFCSNLRNYPRDMVESMVSDLNDDVYDFAEQSPLPEQSPDQLKTRFRDAARIESPACATRTQAYYPQVARNLKNDLSWIVNDVNVNGMMLRQRVDTVTCVKEKSACNSQLQTPASFRTECRQGYMQVKMLSISKSKKQKVVDTFRFPSYCQCFVVPEEGFQFRQLNKTDTETTDAAPTTQESLSESELVFRIH